MKLLVIVLCLLSERFLIHGISYQRFVWFKTYYTSMFEFTAGKAIFNNPWLRLVVIIFPLVFAVSIIYFLFHSLIFGLVGFLLSLLIFFYCLGPQNPFYPLAATDDDAQNNVSAGNYFADVNGQLFAVIFWYLVGGPIAVLTYRLIALSRNIASIEVQANQLTDVLDWIPARLTALLFLLVGNFQSGLSVFSYFLLSKPSLNGQMLRDCGLKAARTRESDEEVPILSAERLVEHSVVVLLVFVALLSLVTST